MSLGRKNQKHLKNQHSAREGNHKHYSTLLYACASSVLLLCLSLLTWCSSIKWQTPNLMTTLMYQRALEGPSLCEDCDHLTSKDRKVQLEAICIYIFGNLAGNVWLCTRFAQGHKQRDRQWRWDPKTPSLSTCKCQTCLIKTDRDLCGLMWLEDVSQSISPISLSWPWHSSSLTFTHSKVAAFPNMESSEAS